MRVFLQSCMFILIFTTTIFAADSQTFQSGPGQTALIELYTSEGCSSCPAAEAWLSEFVDDPRLWDDFVPVAFHVDYWDRLGWKDIFASEKYTERQERYAAGWRSKALYTPGIVWNGFEWKNWFQSPEIPEINARKAGILKVQSQSSGKFLLSFDPSQTPDSAFTAHAALLGFGLISDVQAGENKGKKLKHDFTVLDYEEKPLTRENGIYEAEFQLKSQVNVTPSVYGVAFWVSERNKSVPVQAAGGFLEK